MASVLIMYDDDAADSLEGPAGTRVAVGVFSVNGQPFALMLDPTITFLVADQPTPLLPYWFDMPLILPPGHTLEAVPL